MWSALLWKLNSLNGKKIMICVHTFDDDFLCGKNCFVIVAPHELIIQRLIIKEIKASNAIDVVK